MIEVKNLVKRYGAHCAVDHLNFTVEEGQIYGFLGPNGAGKSTTMNIMTGYLSPTEGEIIVNGRKISEEPGEVRRLIGYLPEIPPLYTDMTVKETLEFAAGLKKVPKKEIPGQVEKVMEMTHISQVGSRVVKNLSKGYRQRVGLAQAIIGFPPVIILDEPSVGLDPQQIIEIRELILSLSKNHIIILSSHILSEIQAVCNHILIINHGRLIASDTPENLEARYGKDNSLELIAESSVETVQRALGAVQGINVLTIAQSGNQVEVKLTYPKEKDPRVGLFYAFAKESCPIVTMRVTEATLEQVFLNLIAEDAKAAQEEEAVRA